MKTLYTKFKMRKMSTSISLQDHMLSTSCTMMNFSWLHQVTQFPRTEPGIVEISVTFSPKMDPRYRMVKTYGPTQWKNESKTGNLFILHKESVHFVTKNLTSAILWNMEACACKPWQITITIQMEIHWHLVVQKCS